MSGTARTSGRRRTSEEAAVRNTRLKSVELRCGHHVLVPSYQTRRVEAYRDTHCSKCEAIAYQEKKGKK